MHRIGQSPEKGREEEQELTCGIPVRKYQSLLFTPTWLGRVGTTVRRRRQPLRRGSQGLGHLLDCDGVSSTVAPCSPVLVRTLFDAKFSGPTAESS